MDRLRHAYASHRYAILFYSLLATLGAAPLLAALNFDAAMLELFLALNLLASVFGVEAGRSRRALVTMTLIALMVHFATGQAALGIRPAALAFWTGIAFLSAAFALRFALRSGGVEAEHIYAALSAYLLGGVFFGVLYHAVGQAWPGSFGVSGAGAGLNLPDSIYFSFVTLATLGYGDVVPVTEVARGLAVIEAVIGQLFLAVMIARLVGSYAQRQDGKRS